MALFKLPYWTGISATTRQGAATGLSRGLVALEQAGEMVELQGP